MIFAECHCCNPVDLTIDGVLSCVQPAVDVTQPASANAISSTVPAPHTDEDRAASKIQALARGQIVRQHQKDQRLWQVWNELDWVRTHTHTDRHTHADREAHLYASNGHTYS